MPNASHSLLNFIRTVAGAWRNDPRDDDELLARFVDGRDEVAFQTLVYRHAPMVWRTCKRVLRSSSDAEDAFQITFVALTRKADKLRGSTLAGWLHRVARQSALNADIDVRRREKLKHQPAAAVRTEEEDVYSNKLRAALDEELAGLPEKLRVPLVLRYLEEKTQDEVANILGCSRTAARNRLARGEAVLRQRLERRGLTLGAVSMATLLVGNASAPAVPTCLIESTAQAAVAFHTGTLSSVTAEAAEKLLRSLTWKGWLGKGWLVVLTATSVFGSSVAIWKMVGNRNEAVERANVPISAPKQSVRNARRSPIVKFQDPLPDGALARLGTVRFRGPGKSCGGVALSLDGKTLASAHSGRTGHNPHSDEKDIIRFWDAATGKQLRETVLKKPCWGVPRIVFSPDGKLLVATGSLLTDNQVSDVCWLLDVGTGQLAGDPLSGSWPAVFTPDGKTLACRSGRTSFALYDVGSRQLLQTVRMNDAVSDVSSALFSRDGRSLAYVEQKGTVHLLDVQSGQERMTLRGMGVVALAFTADGNVVTAERDKTVRVWDAKSGTELRTLGMMTEVPSLVDCLPADQVVLAACAGQIRCWEVATGRETRPAVSCEEMLCPLLLSSDGTKLVERMKDALILWDVATGKETGPAAGASRSPMDWVAFSPDGMMLATAGSEDSEIQIWEAATGKPVCSLTYDRKSILGRCMNWGISWPLGDTLMARVVGKEPRILRWTNVFRGEPVITPEVVHSNGIQFSPDGQVLARWQPAGLELLETPTGKWLGEVPLGTLPMLPLFCNPPIFSADHRILASQLWEESTITLWDVSSGRRLSSFKSSDGRDRIVGFSPDGRLIATRDFRSQVIRLWESDSGRLRLQLPSPSEYCEVESNVAFSFDGRLLATGYLIGPEEDRTIDVWDLATGQRHQRFRGHHAGVGDAGTTRVVFSPDGRRLASAGRDYSVLIWDVRPPPNLAKTSKAPVQGGTTSLDVHDGRQQHGGGPSGH